MKDVNRYVTGKYAQYWNLIGQNLEVPHLSTIQTNHHTHPTPNQQCFRVMIDNWLQIDVTATWEKLQEAINGAIQAQHGILQTGTYAYLHDISIKQRLHVYPCCIFNM